MNDRMYLQTYLDIGSDWPLNLISIDAQKNDPIFTSMQMFVISFPEKTHEDFIAWRHHRLSNQWQDVIYWMSESEFQSHWPLIAGALSEQGDES